MTPTIKVPLLRALIMSIRTPELDDYEIVKIENFNETWQYIYVYRCHVYLSYNIYSLFSKKECYNCVIPNQDTLSCINGS